jgi:N-glycosylase/DNA lyase
MNLRVKLPYSLKHSLDCGQVFRWEQCKGSYLGVVGDSMFKVEQRDNKLTIEQSSYSKNGTDIEDYLDASSDIAPKLREIDADENIHMAIEQFKGLRIFRQLPWECIISFIISSYNNIPRIKTIIRNMSRFYGKRISLNGYSDFSFPAPSSLARASVRDLRKLGLGFRAEYIIDSSRKFVKEEERITSLYAKTYEEAKDYLLGFSGVGEKVADCVLLFAFKKYEAFPVDIRINRIIEELYFKGEKVSPKKIREFARKHFGRFCGYAQQYLYHYEGYRRRIKRSKGGTRLCTG